MDTTYDWEIGPIDVDQNTWYGQDKEDLENVIKCVHWKLVATDGETNTKAWVSGSVSLKDPDFDSYTEYDEVTKEQALDWVLEKLSNNEGVSVEEITDKLKEQVDQELFSKRYVITKVAPWVNKLTGR